MARYFLRPLHNKRILIQPLFQGRPSHFHSRMSILTKIKVIVTLVALTHGICAFFNGLSDPPKGNRTLGDAECKTIPELIDGMDEDVVRRLHRDPFERLSELGTIDPCLTESDGQRTFLKCKTIPEMMHERISDGTESRNLYEAAHFESKTPYEKLLELELENPCLNEIDVQRAMGMCKTIPELIAEMDDDGVRKLHSAPFDYDSRTLYERILELGSEDRCITELPSEIGEVIATQELIDTMTVPSGFVIIDGGSVIIDDPLPSFLDRGELNATKWFLPKDHNIGGTVEGALMPDKNNYGTIAYTVALTGCPEWYEPEFGFQPLLSPDLYEASAILKTGVCVTSEMAASKMDHELAAEMDFSMHAFVHPMCTECPVEGADGDTYDRVTFMKSLGYQVHIVGHPITNEHMEDAKQYYIMENIENDVGIRDSTKLHIWRMIYHPVVVLMNHNTILQQPLDEEIDRLLANDNMKGMYVLHAPDPETNGAGVDTGLLIIKPDLEEYERILDAYINTPYKEERGWNGQGYNNFPGKMGIPGFLAYYFDKDPGYEELDRCQYAHDADDACNEDSVADSKAAKIVSSVCGNPRDCPYDRQEWRENKKESCAFLHRKYFEYRYKLEEDYFRRDPKQRIGFFKPESFLGYCAGAGKKYYLSLLGSLIPTPEWHEEDCPPCDKGTYLKPDGTCTDNPCDACPENTYCRSDDDKAVCIDCNCGFCDSSSTACCDLHNIDGCKMGSGSDNHCTLQRNFFPAFPGSNSACDGAEISRKTPIPNGCGCKPSSSTKCLSDRGGKKEDQKCFICTAADLANSNGKCNACKVCIRSCTDSSCIDDAVTESDFVECLSSLKDSTCRASCHGFCIKSGTKFHYF